jgi:FkbM family methyltransferase
LKQLLRSIIPTKVWASLRLWRINRGINSFRPRQVKHRYFGIDLTVQLSDGLGQGWYDSDWPMSTEIEILRRHGLRPGACVFDLGAHQGVIACAMEKFVQPGGKVIAVEAQPHNAEVAEANKSLNGCDHLEVIHAAAAANPGELIFGGSLNGQVDDGDGDWGRFKVRAVSVDELAAEYGPPDVLFVDVEGYEIEVLRGAAKTLENAPDVFIEVHVGEGLETFGGSPAQVAAFFNTDRYELIMFSDKAPTPLPFEAQHALAKARFYILALSRARAQT